MKLKKKEDQSVVASVFLRRGNKILTGANIKTKCVAETEGKAIQRLPDLMIHPIYSHYCGCQEVHTDRRQIQLSPESLCQSLTNSEAHAHSQSLD